MRQPLLLLGVAASLLASACASKTLTTAGQAVRLQKSDPPEQCSELGSVSARTAFDLDGAKNIMRNEAAEKGGNYVRWDTVEGEYHLTGSAYACPEGEATPVSSSSDAGA